MVANLFFENSTRTRSSFEIAAKALGADVLNWTRRGSSVSKGETLLDTVRNIDAMGPASLVIRHPRLGRRATWSPGTCAAPVINAGDGTHEHPSQALLDAFTLRERWGTLEGKTVAIVGDILHSRVARSQPPLPRAAGGAGGALRARPRCSGGSRGARAPRCTPSSTRRSAEADAVMMLRVQLERQNESLFPSAASTRRLFGLNAARAARLKPDAVVLHPGPDEPRAWSSRPRWRTVQRASSWSRWRTAWRCGWQSWRRAR